jgi:hypothetical protein
VVEIPIRRLQKLNSVRGLCLGEEIRLQYHLQLVVKVDILAKPAYQKYHLDQTVLAHHLAKHKLFYLL